MSILILAEHDNTQLKSATLPVITAASYFKAPITVLVAGQGCDAVVKTVQGLAGVDRVLVADHPCYAHPLAENLADLMQTLASDYTTIIAPATTFGKNVLPRLAALLDVSVVSDVIAIESMNTFVRPIYAGNVLATVTTDEAIKLLTIRPTAFAATTVGTTQAVVEPLTTVIENKLAQFQHHELTQSTRPELTAARVVISGGRGLKSAENFQLIEQLADQLGAAVGASRAAVDAGFAPNDYQVGQTGKVVAPELYIAIGISGAIQHLAGMKDSRVIVAINSDPDAPIFEVADYGLVGDLFTLLPELKMALTAGSS